MRNASSTFPHGYCSVTEEEMSGDLVWLHNVCQLHPSPISRRLFHLLPFYDTPYGSQDDIYDTRPRPNSYRFGHASATAARR